MCRPRPRTRNAPTLRGIRNRVAVTRVHPRQIYLEFIQLQAARVALQQIVQHQQLHVRFRWRHALLARQRLTGAGSAAATTVTIADATVEVVVHATELVHIVDVDERRRLVLFRTDVLEQGGRELVQILQIVVLCVYVCMCGCTSGAKNADDDEIYEKFTSRPLIKPASGHDGLRCRPPLLRASRIDSMHEI